MITDMERLKEEVKKLLAEGKDSFTQMDEFSEWNSLSEVISNFGVISQFINKLVLAVEVAANDMADDVEGLKSEDKVEAAAQIMDEMIALPFFLEAIDQKVFSLLISMAVEGLNVRFGKEWDLDGARDAIKTGKDFISKVADNI